SRLECRGDASRVRPARWPGQSRPPGTRARAAALAGGAPAGRAGGADRRGRTRGSRPRARRIRWRPRSSRRPLREHGGRQPDPQLLERLGELGPDAGWDGTPEEAAVAVHPGAVVEHEDVLERDGLALHAVHLGYRGDATGAVAQAGELDD